MPAKPILIVGAIAGALALSACNATRGSYPQPAAASGTPALVTPPGFHLPSGAGCQGAADRFQALIDEDLQVGHTVKSVHDQVSAEIAHARATCAAGNARAAEAEIVASRTRHGYPAH